ncbi:MAG: helix-turn-helix transcriptional regulator [Clostridia bacterium]|nr:helix-turn-helix transcriptional regulator [Clostridia bacterium]
MDTLKIFASRLNIILKERNLSVYQFAKLIHSSPKSVEKWKTEKQKPRIKTIIKIARSLKISSDYLLGLQDEKTPKKKNSVG